MEKSLSNSSMTASKETLQNKAIFLSFFTRDALLATADQHVWLNTDLSEQSNRVLRRLGL